MRVLLPAVSSLLLGVVCSSPHDVVIVGSGPGGLVAAEYLTRYADLSVLMLEAGPLSLQASGGTDVLPYSKAQGWTQFDVPGEFDNVAYNPLNDRYRVDWLGDQPYTWLGKLLGGCSSINAALYFRTPDSYVAKASWPFSASQVADGFDEIEQFFHSTETPSADGKPYVQEAYTIVRNALEKVGYVAVNGSLNAKEARNAKSATLGHPPYAVHDGLRDAPAKTFFSKLKDRKNFELLTDAKVEYIQQSQGQATGVVFTREKNTVVQELTQRGVVVLAAGALSTPAILIQSGVGPKKQLQALATIGRFDGLKNSSAWVENENVGQHVFDTTVVYGSFQHPDMKPFLNKLKPADAIAQYVADRSGPWATPGPVLLAYENAEYNGREFELQTTVLPHGFGNFYETKNAFSAGMFLNNPKSRDSVSFSVDGELIAATNKSWYGSDDGDVSVLTQHVRKMVNAFVGSGAKFLNEASVSPEALSAWVKKSLGAVTHHFGGSCYAAVRGDTSHCADENFRVLGTKNIFVSDASLMKEGTVNPYGFVMYIGNQAAKNILVAAFEKDLNNSYMESDGIDSTTSPSRSSSGRVRGVIASVVVVTTALFSYQ